MDRVSGCKHEQILNTSAAWPLMGAQGYFIHGKKSDVLMSKYSTQNSTETQ